MHAMQPDTILKCALIKKKNKQIKQQKTKTNKTTTKKKQKIQSHCAHIVQSISNSLLATTPHLLQNHHAHMQFYRVGSLTYTASSHLCVRLSDLISSSFVSEFKNADSGSETLE